MPLNVAPGAGFMQRMLGATNAVGQSMGGPMGQTSRMTAGMNQNRINRQPMPARQTMPNTGMMPQGNPNPMGMGGRMGSPGMPMSAPMGSPMGGQPPNMPLVQGPSSMPNFQLGRDTGGNTGITGGMNGPMGGFGRPQVDTGNVMDDSQLSNPMGGGGIWNRYQSMQRPQQLFM